MKKVTYVTAALTGLLSMPSVAAAQAAAKPSAPAAAPAPATTPAGHYTTATTEFGVLWDDPAAHAVVVKYLPDLGKPEVADGLQMARGMTLRTLQQFKPEFFTDEKLAAIDADLAKLPPK